MQANISLLVLLGLICSTIAASTSFQTINVFGEGGSPLVRRAGNNEDWSDSAHNSDTDKLLRELEKLDNNRNNNNNFVNTDALNFGSDTDRSREDSEERRLGFQFIQFG